MIVPALESGVMALSETAAATGREDPWRAIGRVYAGMWTMSGLPSRLFTALIIFAGAVPYAGWVIPSAWLAGVVGLIAAHAVWKRRPGGAPMVGEVDVFLWLLSAAYAAAAFYLTLLFDRAAQTLGVCLYGVIMFQVLARDYARPRRLIANLLPLVAFVVLVQMAAAALLLFGDRTPWRLITLLASPLIVFRAFLAVRQNLNRSLVGRREAMAKLAESETRYRTLAERSPDVIVRLDAEARIEYVSPAAAGYGWDPERLIGQRMSDIVGRGGLQPHGPRRSATALRGGGPNVWRTIAADGAPRWFESRAALIVGDDGRPQGALSVLRDITERLALEDELRAKRAEAEAAVVAKSEFLANMSHEIRTPLTGVVGFAGLLREMEGLPEEAQRYAQRIAASAEALLAVVNDVLDFSRLEAGQMALERRPFDPRELAWLAADLVRDRASAKGVALEVEVAADMPEALSGDAGRLRQVLLNLLSNAAKFTDAGQIVVAARYDGGAERLRVEVRDTGAGIPEGLQARLFQRFSQVDASSTRAHGGAGLGLAICKAIVEAMGGEIGMTSAPGAGSTFWFEVPAPAATAAVAAAPPTGPADAPLGPLTLLVVDDVPVNRELVATILSPFEMTIFQAAGGREAVTAAGERRFDLILMDLQMPGMDGMAAARAIRADCGLNRETPILALSANVLEEQVAACLAAGMDDHVAKPIRPAELLAKIAAWTAAERAPAPVALAS
jgi:PAS domain S-box-containing protein